MTVQLSLTVNGKPINTDYFVAGFIDHTVSGMVESLEHTGEIKELNLSINGDKVAIKLNGEEVPVNVFVTKIIKSTTLGMVAPLKGVDQVENLSIAIKK